MQLLHIQFLDFDETQGLKRHISLCPAPLGKAAHTSAGLSERTVLFLEKIQHDTIMECVNTNAIACTCTFHGNIINSVFSAPIDA
eukprot:jgi/Antlo1/2274/2566